MRLSLPGDTMTNAQTEARAIARKYTTVPAEDRINLSREIATALAAKDAELERRDMQLEASAKVALDLSAQLAEARKALEAFINRIPAAAWKLPDGALVAKTGIEIEYFRAARRALEGDE